MITLAKFTKYRFTNFLLQWMIEKTDVKKWDWVYYYIKRPEIYREHRMNVQKISK